MAHSHPSSGRKRRFGRGDGRPPVLTAPPSPVPFEWLGALSALGFAGVSALFVRGLTGNLDRSLSEAVVTRRTLPRTVANAAFSIAGSALGISGILGILALRAKEKDREMVRFLIVQTIALGLVNEAVKLPFRRQRPPFGLYREITTGYPSSHAAASVAFFGLLAILLLANGGRYRWLAPLLIGSMPAIGVSRVYLGVHWPTDVIAGYMLGGSFLGASGAYLARRRPSGKRRKLMGGEPRRLAA
jgi:undecaprenyl-diphosphatase